MTAITTQMLKDAGCSVSGYSWKVAKDLNGQCVAMKFVEMEWIFLKNFLAQRGYRPRFSVKANSQEAST